ncbi:MAG TPA: efflux RND transporter periplasmic adaptor subunit, partial [Blastocatellia bacterium]|nr:efflux RND transporter periplasmic adaptor subunit [Blastocatellia bacterium]
RLDDRDARLRLQQAQAAQRQAEAALMQAQQRLGLDRSGNFDVNAVAEVRSARLAYESAEAEAKLAETNARRYERLVETGDVSRAVYDQARTQADTARAQANAARQQLEVAINQARLNNTGIAAAQAAVEAARTQTGLAQKALADTVITAPYSGYISDRPAAVGEYVNTQSKIATLLRTNPIKLRLQLPEADAGKVRPGMSVTANVTAFPGKEFSGKVTMINPAIDPASRTITVEAEIQNPANELRPNMFATARINQPEGVTAVLVPRSAVILDPATNSQRVYVIEGDNKSDTIARLRVVQTGEQDGDRVRIVTGVNAGEAVAISNLDQLYDGAKVRRQ